MERYGKVWKGMERYGEMWEGIERASSLALLSPSCRSDACGMAWRGFVTLMLLPLALALGVVKGIAVDTDEQVGLGFIGDGHPLFERRKVIPFPRHDNFHIGKPFTDVLAQQQCHIECHLFLRGSVPFRAEVAGVCSAVPGVDHDDHAWRHRSERNRKENDGRHAA